jgi:hypothetical protein
MLMTITPSQLNKPEEEIEAYPHGALGEYSQDELALSKSVRRLDLSLTKTENDWRVAVVKLKLKLDGDHLAAGGTLGGGHGNGSRFWQTCERGDHGPRLQRWAEEGDRKSVSRWLNANDAAAKLLNSRVAHATQELPLMTAQEQGIGLSTLHILSSMGEKAQELARLIYEATGTIKADMAKECTRIANEYPELYDKVADGIRTRRFRVPDDVRKLCADYREHKAAQLSADRERQRLEREAAARTAAEAQAEADRKLAEEIESSLPIEPKDAPAPEQGTPPAPPADEPKILTTYPVQELLDGVAFEGLQKRYERDTTDFFNDMRELYAAVRKVDEITNRWAERLQDEHLSGHKQEMLLWETYSVAWNRLGKFKKLGGGKIKSVPDFWAMIGDLSQRAKGATTRCITYSQLSVKKYGPFKVAETSDEHYQPGRVEQ